MADVREVAKYLISLSRESSRYAITPLKLQKLVYYAQGYHLALTGEPLFEERLEAWEHGPVAPDIYHIYKKHRYFTIPREPFNDYQNYLDNEEITTLNRVWNNFGHLDGKTLEELTHQEDPWLFTDINDIIERELIADYFNQYVFQY